LTFLYLIAPEKFIFVIHWPAHFPSQTSMNLLDIKVHLQSGLACSLLELSVGPAPNVHAQAFEGRHLPVITNPRR